MNTRKAKAKQAPRPPAKVVADAKARVAAAVAMPFTTNAEAKRAVSEHAAAQRDINSIPVRMTLGQLCHLLGQNIEPSDFASTALESIADQIETIATIVDNAPDFSQDAWRLFKNLAERTEYAGKIVRWLESDTTSDRLPEVTP